MREPVFVVLKKSLEAAGYAVVPFDETTGPEVAKIAGRGLSDPKSLSEDEIKKVCASALTQVAPAEDQPAVDPAPETQQ